MPYFVYIIISNSDQSYYKGYSENPEKRLGQHNAGLSHYTSAKTPWTLAYLEELSTKGEALIREKALKKYGREQIEKLIQSSKNIYGT